MTNIRIDFRPEFIAFSKILEISLTVVTFARPASTIISPALIPFSKASEVSLTSKTATPVASSGKFTAHESQKLWTINFIPNSSVSLISQAP